MNFAKFLIFLLLSPCAHAERTLGRLKGIFPTYMPPEK